MNVLPAADALAMLQLLLPEAVIAAGIPAVLVVDMLLPNARKAFAAWAGVAVCALAALAALVAAPGRIEGMVVVDGLALFVRSLLLAITTGVLVVAAGETDRHGRIAEDRGAFVVCVLGINLGAMVAALAVNLLPLWLGLETVSLASYALAAWRGGDRRAAEAGMKFVLFGGLASAVTLFGMSHVYGLTGHLDFTGIGAGFGNLPVVALAALGMVAVGVAYKLTVVPFHFYAPDVYQGAPALSVAMVALVPKVAAAVALARGVELAIPSSLASPAAIGNALAWAAGGSLVVAAFTALVQRDAKRILAFSGIGQAGTAVLALACLPADGALRAALFHLLAYSLANLGALLCMVVLEADRGSCQLDALRGAGRERPWLVGGLCWFLFSLIGVPPLVGFFGKWVVLQQALGFGLAGAERPAVAIAALVLVLTTAVSAWSYLLIVRAVVMQAPTEPQQARARVPIATGLVLVVCALLVLVAGFWLDGLAALARSS